MSKALVWYRDFLKDFIVENLFVKLLIIRTVIVPSSKLFSNDGYFCSHKTVPLFLCFVLRVSSLPSFVFASVGCGDVGSTSVGYAC